MSDVECIVDSVKVHELTKQHNVLLKDVASDRVLPIWIGPEQAFAIATRLVGQKSERPLTHDFVIDAFEKLGVKVDSVAVTGLQPQANMPQGAGVFSRACVAPRERSGGRGRLPAVGRDRPRGPLRCARLRR